MSYCRTGFWVWLIIAVAMLGLQSEPIWVIGAIIISQVHSVGQAILLEIRG